MTSSPFTEEPQGKAEMLIRKPVTEVYEAFINPAITSQFWFTTSSGRLDQNQRVEWTWDMYNLTTPVRVFAVEPNKRIVIEWGENDPTVTVEWTFRTIETKGTLVTITCSGFKGTADDILSQVRGSSEGFAIVLASAKALLEHNIQLTLVADRHPEGLGEH